MELEDRVKDEIRSLRDYGNECYRSLNSWVERILFMESSGRDVDEGLMIELKLSKLEHETFHEFINSLDALANSSGEPSPEDYGINAKKWWNNKRKENFSYIFTGGSILGGIGLTLGGFGSTLPFFMTGMIIGTCAGMYFKDKTQECENKEDTQKFIEHRREHYKNIKNLKRKSIEFFEDSMKKYMNSLNTLFIQFRSYGEKEEMRGVMDNLIELGKFEDDFRDVVYSIKKSKKQSLPRFGLGIGPSLRSYERASLPSSYDRIPDDH